MKDMDCSKMGTESLAENTPNAQKHFCPICRPKPKSSEFQWKKVHAHKEKKIINRTDAIIQMLKTPLKTIMEKEDKDHDVEHSI